MVIRVRNDLELRTLEEGDAATLYALTEENRRYLHEWLPWVDQTWSAEDSLRFVRMVRQQEAENNGFSAGLWVDGELAGTIGVHRIDWTNHATSIGYWIAQHRQGRGLVTDACRAVVNHAFSKWGLNRTEIRCATGNHKSRAIPLRLGFRHEGTLREAQWVSAQFGDLEVYAMLAREWADPQIPGG
jgi:ribosomal-protein-serine acetyltransferase